jgi:hypothetical protein
MTLHPKNKKNKKRYSMKQMRIVKMLNKGDLEKIINSKISINNKTRTLNQKNNKPIKNNKQTTMDK